MPGGAPPPGKQPGEPDAPRLQCPWLPPALWLPHTSGGQWTGTRGLQGGQTGWWPGVTYVTYGTTVTSFTSGTTVTSVDTVTSIATVTFVTTINSANLKNC